MLQGLEKAEKSPNKGFKVYPNFEEPEELSGKEEEDEEDEDEDEVMLLDDPSDKSSKQGGTKQCRSNQVKDAKEYNRQGFKIPKKSSRNDCHNNLTSSNVSQETERSSLPKHNLRNNVDSWGFKSSFPDDESPAMKTKLTRNSSLKNRPGRGRNIRQMIHRQDGIGLLRNTSRNTSSSSYNTRIRDEPFNNEINQVMNRNTRTVGHKEKSLIMSNDRDCKVLIADLKNGNNSAQEKQSRKHSTDPHVKEHTCADSSTTDDNENQYLENLYQENLHELHVTSDSEDFQRMADSKVCNNHEENSTQKKECLQRKVLSFPSSAATPRHSIHEHTMSEDEKDDKSNTITFYGSESKPGVFKTYSGRKNRTINNKCGRRKDDNQEVSDVEESPVENSKKRKIHVTTRKNVKKNENSNCEKQRKKHKTEPECLLISSSDEEDNQSGHGDGSVSGTESATSKTKPSENVPTNTSSSKPTAENNVTANGQATGVCTTTGAVDNPFERDSFTTEIMLGPKVMLGKLKGSADGALEITAHQLKWRMKYTDENDKPAEQVVLILASDLTSFKIHVDNDPKVIVLEVNQRCALKLRGKFKGFGKFFDPSSAVVEETDIVLQIDDTLSAETLADITEWVQDRLCKTFRELSHDEAEKLSERLSSNSASKNGDAKQKSRYNTRSSAIKSTTRTAVTPTKMIIYPFPPTPGGITVTSADVECLAESQFLNDVIIDFYLKYIYHDKLSEDDKNRTHIFSSFFYKRLTQKKSVDNDFFGSPFDRMHSQVKKWTRNVDIFSKDFIIVPINESSHWYLAIICFPKLDEPIIEECSSEEQPEEIEIEESEDSDDKEKAKVNVTDDVDDDEDDAEFETSALAVEAKKGTPSKKAAQKNKPVLKASPCILIFDSLANTGRSRVFTNLRNYLSREWKARRPDKPTREFTIQSFKGAFPKVPEQDNHCDCGIFVLQYVESFFEDPIEDYRLPIHKTNWFTHNGISGKRQEIKDLILRLKEKYTSTSS